MPVYRTSYGKEVRCGNTYGKYGIYMKLARLFVINQGKSNMNSTRIFNIYVEMIIRKQGCHAELLPFKERYKNIKQETVMLSPQSKAPYRDSQILGNTAQKRRSVWGVGSTSLAFAMRICRFYLYTGIQIYILSKMQIV